ncbi:hypothetical protein [Methylotenera sp.]|uniref:serine O-acetyltransferase n=1 Tax=Methylotenera sp. TaxID=2051956 RepID=UPI00248793BB|nr:hypothetical protein [Methylotenera sp.]MDI1297804.1 hypothetical protein [Methylotenera sp.]
MSQSTRQTIALLRLDMKMRCDYENKKLTWLRALRFCFLHATLSSIIYRLQVFFFYHYLKPLASLLSFINIIFFAVKIDSSAKIGPGFVMLHANFITIGANVIIGKNCILGHQNTICASPFYCEENLEADDVKTYLLEDINANKAPIIGDHLMMGGGSVIFGNITLGTHVKVSMNSAVDKSFPDHAVLLGVPARNVAKQSDQK